MRLVAKIIVGLFALIGFLVVGLAVWLWLSARPVLDEARAQYGELPAELQCAGAWQPPHYPSGARPLQAVDAAETDVYAAACRGADMMGECAYMAGAPRWLGFASYRRLYLSDCEIRALSLRGDTHLGHALEVLYAGRDPATLTDPERTCLVARTRHGWNDQQRFCERMPNCCPAATQ